jgi:hypothetical protein
VSREYGAGGEAINNGFWLATIRRLYTAAGDCEQTEDNNQHLKKITHRKTLPSHKKPEGALSALRFISPIRKR